MRTFLTWIFISIISFEIHTAQGAVEQKPACHVAESKGDVRYRAAGSLNWVPLGDRKSLFVGDLVFTRSDAHLRMNYVAAEASVQLPAETLFRIGERPPTFTKLRRRFSFDSSEGNKLANGSRSSHKQSPFERVTARNQNEADDQNGRSKPKHSSSESEQLGVNLSTTTLPIVLPAPRSVFLSKAYPSKLSLKVGPEFTGEKVWAFLWNEKDKVKPIWSGYAIGEFTNIPIPRPGTYEVQVVNDDESAISDSITVTFRSANDRISDLLKQLRDDRNADNAFTLE